jgi:hypothetical protein
MAENKTLMDRINQGRQYRSMQMEIRKADEDKEDSYIVEGYATTFNEPYTLYEDDGFRYDEQVDARAFDETDMKDVILQFDHAGKVYARGSNGTLELETDAHGLKVRAKLGGTEDGRKLYEEIKGGYITKMSFGFTVAEDTETRSTEDGKDTYLRTITRIGKLYDVSAVSLPANDGTEISARSLVDGVIARRSEEKSEENDAQKKAEEEEKRKQEEIKAQKERERLALELELGFSLSK